MKVVLATPLYPPEIAEPAPYMKELAKRLAKLHEVTIVAYARLPEKIPGVSIITIDKRQPLPIRLFAFLRALWQATRCVDVVYAENGASVELPSGIIARLGRRPLIMHLGDRAAHKRAHKNSFLRNIEHFALSRAARVITDMPIARPEILPLEPYPAEAFAAYEESWSTHLRALEDAFNYAVS